MKPPLTIMSFAILGGWLAVSWQPAVHAQVSSTAADADQVVRIEVFPPALHLTRLGTGAQLVITGITATGRSIDLTRESQIVPSRGEWVTVQAGYVMPLVNGQAELRITACGLESRVPTLTALAPSTALISFRYGVLAALSKQGCSAGSCHGSPSGKGGFRLSLRGFDPLLDEGTLVHEDFGRRVNRFEPTKSLLLLKPQMKTPHGGGLRLHSADPAYPLLRDWIAQGCQPDRRDAPSCQAIEVFPKRRELYAPAREQQLSVLARFSDGSTHDVTRLTVFSSSDAEAATIHEAGLVSGRRRGETTVIAKYLDFVDTAELTWLERVPGFTWSQPPANNYIDEKVFAKLQHLSIQPSELCGDGEFLRRVYLDVLGKLPTVDEAKAFLADADPDKRARAIQVVLERPEYAEFWAQKLGDLLRVKSSRMSPAGVRKFHRWLVDRVRRNVPYDRFARELLTAQGSTYFEPAANFYRAAGDTSDCAESIAQLFLGVRIQCAKCHNHPADRWSQDHYYGIGAFFSRVARKPTSQGEEVVIFLARTGEVIQPRTGQVMKPWLPLSGDVDVPPDQDRRELFARWLTAPDNPFFTKVAVNRVWGQLLGRGIVDPVDDFHAGNPPSNGELLQALADDFQRSGYDVKHLVHTILSSRTYQLSSLATPQNEADIKYFSHGYARLLTAEQLSDAVCDVTGVPEKFQGMLPDSRATHLPSPDMGSDFLKAFGQPLRNTVCACERSNNPKLVHALELINGPLLSRKLRDKQSRLARWLNQANSSLIAAGEPPPSSLVLWLRADRGVLDTNGVDAVDSDRVAAWHDQAAAQGHLSQNEPHLRPVFVAEAMAGLPALRFDGHDDFLNNTTRNVIESGRPRTVLIVARAQQHRGGALFTFRRATAGGTTVFTCQHVSLAGTYYVYSDGTNATGNSTLNPDQLPVLQEPFLTTFLSHGEGTKIQVGVNGQERPVTQAGAIGPDNGASGFTLGNREDIPPGEQGWGGDIAEVLVYDRVLNAEELAAAGSYLTTKYGLKTSYPGRQLPPKVNRPNAVTDQQILTELYLAALCRYPTDRELALAADHIRLSGDRRQGLEDLLWALLNSKEFLFRH